MHIPIILVSIVALAGCMESRGIPLGSGPASPPHSVGEVRTMVSEGNATDPVALGSHGIGYQCARLEVFPGNVTSAQILAFWNASTPTAQSLKLVIFMEEGGCFGRSRIAEGTGTSPFILMIRPDDVTPPAILASFDGDSQTGALVKQDVHFVLFVTYAG